MATILQGMVIEQKIQVLHIRQKKSRLTGTGIVMSLAEREGFEPSKEC